jgi:hypothetical protein
MRGGESAKGDRQKKTPLSLTSSRSGGVREVQGTSDGVLIGLGIGDYPGPTIGSLITAS